MIKKNPLEKSEPTLKSGTCPIKREVLERVESAIALAERSLEKAMEGHRWKVKRQRDDKVLDAASKCFKNDKNARVIHGRIERMRNPERIAEELVKFEKEFAWVEADLKELSKVIEG